MRRKRRKGRERRKHGGEVPIPILNLMDSHEPELHQLQGPTRKLALEQMPWNVSPNNVPISTYYSSMKKFSSNKETLFSCLSTLNTISAFSLSSVTVAPCASNKYCTYSLIVNPNFVSPNTSSQS